MQETNLIVHAIDEAQGLTEALIKAWLERNGWQPAPRAEGASPARVWERAPGKAFFDYAFQPDFFLAVVEDLAWLEKRSMQQILREMNPRMRAGCPSKEARLAHPGLWIAKQTEKENGYLVKFDERSGPDPYFEMHSSPYRDEWDRGMSYQISSWRGGFDKWSFWPCDEHGNKVRWPVDAGGDPL